MRKIIFLDIDGTLVDFKQNILNSTKEALKKAKEKGHYLVICTGRTYPNIYPFLFDLDFDGIIASTGANVFWQGKEIFYKALPKDSLQKVIKVLDKYNAIYIFEGKEGLYADERSYKGYKEYIEKLGSNIEEVMSDITICEKPYNKKYIEGGIYNSATVDLNKIQQEVGDEIKITGSSFGHNEKFSGEFTKKGVNKAFGIEYLLNYLNMDKEDVIAFGDGLNDIEMLQGEHRFQICFESYICIYT